MKIRSTKKLLECRITLGDDHSLNLHARDMNELVDKIIEWTGWDNNKNFLPSRPIKNWYYYQDKKAKKKVASLKEA